MLRILGDGLREGFANSGLRPFYLSFFLAGGALWAAVATGVYTRSGGLAEARWARPDSAARWGRTATLVAAACALPYGLMLGSAALCGGVLTLGLISRWGEVWPRWVPALRGKPVPIAAAVVPGATVAALFTRSGFALSRSMIEQEQYAYLVVFPFLIWGPALAAATLAYYLRRRPVTR